MAKFPGIRFLQRTTTRPAAIVGSLLLTITSYQAGAQKTFIEFRPIAFPLANKTFFVDSVVDNRVITEEIGVVQVGLGNKQVAADFERGLVPTLENYFVQVTYFPGVVQQRLTVVIDGLWISERTNNLSERGIADLSITFCILDSGRLMTLHKTKASVETGGMDVTDTHGLRIQQALRNCVEEFARLDWEHLPRTPWTSRAAESETLASENNITTCAVRKKGIYTSFEGLRSNSPVDSPAFIVEEKKSKIRLRDSATKIVIKKSYGFCDGKDIYINTHSYNPINPAGIYARVKEVGRYLAWYDHYVGAGSYAFALVGFGVFAAAAARSHLDVIVLDMKSGAITPIDIPRLEKLLKQNPELLAKYRAMTSGHDDVNIQMAYIMSLNRRLEQP
ncbi:MAG: DUF6563 family protein [Cytophagales bacterium]|nr:DUF6563 family protein [Cytophagales bacterium]